MADAQGNKMDYIVKHKIYVLFEELAAQLLANQPEQPIPFLMEQLSKLNGNESHTTTTTTTDKKEEEEKKPEEKTKMTFAVFGLDQAGKTTLISAVGGEVDTNTAPTVGFSPNHFQGEEWDLMMFDLGGGHKFRGIWKKYFSELHAIVFVVDAAEESRFSEAKEALWGILQDDRASDKPLLVFANKQDKSTAKTSLEIENILGIAGVPCHHVYGCSAIADPVDSNIEQGMEWVLKEVQTQHGVLSERIKVQLAKDKERRRKELDEQRKRVEEYRKQWAEEDAEKARKKAEGKDVVKEE